MHGGHHHGHDHNHGDHHDHHHHAHGHHHHAPERFDAAFAVGIGLNTAFVIAQAGFGWWANSLALMADAAHNLGDVLGLVAAWAASVMARRAPSARRSYGWGRGTILASLGNAVVLLLSCGAIGVEAIQRFTQPAPVGGATVMWVAAIGIAINGGTAMMFARGRHGDLNLRGAFLHMLADALVSAGVVAAGLAITLTGWSWLDPASSLAIVAVIVWGTWGLLRESAHLAMDGVPPSIRLAEVEATLAALPGVLEVHDLHVWSLSTTEIALTAHLVREPGEAPLLPLAAERMRSRFGIGHATFQVETRAEAEACALRPAHVV